MDLDIDFILSWKLFIISRSYEMYSIPCNEMPAKNVIAINCSCWLELTRHYTYGNSRLYEQSIKLVQCISICHTGATNHLHLNRRIELTRFPSDPAPFPPSTAFTLYLVSSLLHYIVLFFLSHENNFNVAIFVFGKVEINSMINIK